MNRLLTVRKFLHLTQREMADIMSIKQNAYSMIENGHINLSDRNRKLLIEKLHINPHWLSGGEGEMFESISQNPPYAVGVPYFSVPINECSPIDLTGQIDGAIYISSPPDYVIDLEPFNDASFYRKVGVSGMSPRYDLGDIIACKIVDNKDIILYGEPYLILLVKDDRHYEMLRIIRKSTDPKMVIMRPLNSEYDEIEVEKMAVVQLYMIKGKIVQNS